MREGFVRLAEVPHVDVVVGYFYCYRTGHPFEQVAEHFSPHNG